MLAAAPATTLAQSGSGRSSIEAATVRASNTPLAPQLSPLPVQSLGSMQSPHALTAEASV
eukprot:6174852-Pleurochrysis_carterae.AAC.3